MVVHMALELFLEAKVRPAAPSGAVCVARAACKSIFLSCEQGNFIGLRSDPQCDKGASSIFRPSSNPVCGSSMMEQVRRLFGPWRTGLAFP